MCAYVISQIWRFWPLSKNKLKSFTPYLTPDTLSAKWNLWAQWYEPANEKLYTYHSNEKQKAQLRLHICSDAPEPSMLV